ncbi:DUF5011 domain-containing protein [Lachnospiraceae bacterium]|nr:DUF5011 domain-containing protein [Lachnospiraceae bacterium]
MIKKKVTVVLAFCIILLSAVFTGKGEAQAAGSYTLQVNKGTNVVTVFRDGKPDRAFVCSVGSATPIGTFYTPNKLRWHVLDGPSYGQYCTRITGGFLFHSVWYYVNGNYASQSYVQYNKLGTTASHGCVRLTVADAKWIYDNCPLGTKVTIIYGSASNDPLGKPEAIKIPAKYGSRGWDPTDPMAGNPYSSLRPSIDVSGAQTKIAYGSEFNPYAGIVGRDSLGNDISHKLTSNGTVNTKKVGSYRITYIITDALGRSASAEVVYTVADTQGATIKGVKKSQQKEYNSTLKLRAKVKAYTVDKKNLTKNIQIKIVYPKGKTEKIYRKSTIKLKKLGTYKINYYVTNPNNGMETKVTSKVTVKDTKKPKFTGVASRKTFEYNAVKNLKYGVKAKLVSGKNMTSKIVVKIKVPGGKKYKKLSETAYKKYKFSKTGTYYVQFSVTNPYNKKAVAQKETAITIRDTKKPQITGITAAKTVEYKDVLNLKDKVTAKLLSGKDMTSAIAIKVKAPGESQFQLLNTAAYTSYCFHTLGVYSVEYSVANPDNQNAVAVKTMEVTVKDTKAPVISGVKEQLQVTTGEGLDLRKDVTAALLSGIDVTAQIKITVKTPDGKEAEWKEAGAYTFNQTGSYKIIYTAINPDGGAQVKAEMTVVAAEGEKPAVSPQNGQEVKEGLKAGN